MSILANQKNKTPEEIGAGGDAAEWADYLRANTWSVATRDGLRDVLAVLINGHTAGNRELFVETGLITQEVVYAPPPGLGAALCLTHDNLLKIAGQVGAIVTAIAPELVEEEAQAADGAAGD